MGRKRERQDIERWIREGRGQGSGASYKPWLTVQSFSSLGYAHRVPGWKTGRTHHLMSNLELDFFHFLEWADTVRDAREQFPLLPLEETIAIAKALGIRHPTDERSKDPVVMTSDFVITCHGKPGDVDQVRTIKPASELESARTMQKFEIERQYWLTRCADWGIVTEADMPENVTHNLRWLHPYFKLPEMTELSQNCSAKVDELLRLSLGHQVGLATACNACDDRLGLSPGSSLSFARHFIATKRWEVDLNRRIDTSRPLNIMNQSVQSDHGTVHQYAA
jgi:hypothetical protein